MIKRVSRAGLIVSILWSVIVFLWERVGDFQQAQELFRGRGATIEVIGRLLLAPWFGPAIALACLLAYLAVEQDAKTFSPFAPKRKKDTDL